MTIQLDGYSLNTKHGFEDGDVLGETLMEIYPGTIGVPKDLTTPPMFPEYPDTWHYDFEHIVLHRLVSVHLLPLLPGREIMFIHTHHNPIRFVDWGSGPKADDVSVDISTEQVREAAAWVEAEWRAGRAGVPLAAE